MVIFVGVIRVEQLFPEYPGEQLHPQFVVEVPPFKQVTGVQGVEESESEEQLKNAANMINTAIDRKT